MVIRKQAEKLPKQGLEGAQKCTHYQCDRQEYHHRQTTLVLKLLTTGMKAGPGGYHLS